MDIRSKVWGTGKQQIRANMMVRKESSVPISCDDSKSIA